MSNSASTLSSIGANANIAVEEDQMIFPEGAVTITVEEHYGHLYLESIVAEPQGIGLGSKAISALKDYCYRRHLSIQAGQVIDERFFTERGFIPEDEDTCDEWQEGLDFWWNPEQPN